MNPVKQMEATWKVDSITPCVVHLQDGLHLDNDLGGTVCGSLKLCLTHKGRLLLRHRSGQGLGLAYE